MVDTPNSNSSDDKCEIVFNIIQSLERGRMSRTILSIRNMGEKKGLSSSEIDEQLEKLVNSNRVAKYTYASKLSYKINQNENQNEATPCLTNAETPVLPKNSNFFFHRYATSPRKETSPVTRVEFENLLTKVNNISTQLEQKLTKEQFLTSKINSLEREIKNQVTIIDAKNEIIDTLEKYIKLQEEKPEATKPTSERLHNPMQSQAHNANLQNTNEIHKPNAETAGDGFISPTKRHTAKRVSLQVEPITTQNFYEPLSEQFEKNSSIQREDKIGTASARGKSAQEKSTQNKTSQNKKPKKHIIILGDSIVKNLDGFKMSRKGYNVTTHSLPGGNTAEMEVLSQAMALRKPDAIFLHCGTNDLFPKSGRDTQTRETPPLTPKQVVANLKDIEQILNAKSPNTQVIISNLTTRTDHGEVGASKVRSTNSLILKSGMPCVSHNNITNDHLNGSKLHLNGQGTIEMSKNFRKYIEKYCVE